MTLMENNVLFVILLIICLSCDNRTRAELFQDEYVSNQAQGIIREIELMKGCLLSIEFENGQSVGLLDACTISNVIRNGDSLVKYKNSAKVLLYRRDSVFAINSITPKVIPSEDLDSIETFEFWNENFTNRWYHTSEFKY
tara:strand:- start:169 stop:588 length:420 start_codon:yes stop_codon:yes gene_type:complete